MAVQANRAVRAYRTDDPEVPQLLTVRGVRHIKASAVVSWMALSLPTTTFENYKGPLLDALNDPDAFDPVTGELRILLDTKVARNWFNKTLRRGGTKLKAFRGCYSFEHPGNQDRIDLMITAVRKFVDGAKAIGCHPHAQHPIEINGYHLLSEADKAVLAAKDAKKDNVDYRRNTGRYYRGSFVPRKLRTEAIFCIDEITRLTEASGLPTFVKLPTLVITETAIRARESVTLCMWGIWKGCRFKGTKILVRNKGRGNLPTKEIVLSTTLMARLLNWIDGDRKELDASGRGLAEFEELGRRANLGDKKALKTMLDANVYLNSIGTKLTYENLTGTYLRRLFRINGLDATLHWMRHEYTFNRLRQIDAMPVNDREKDLNRKLLAEYMGWTSTRMFRIYDAYHEANLRLLAHNAYMAAREAGVSAAQQRAELPDEDPWVPPSVMRASPARRSFMSIGRPAERADITFAI